jgi:hypothetical protein
VPSVQVPVPVVLEVPHHLLRGALDPLGRLDVRALVLAQLAEVVGLGLDYAPRVVVGEWVLGILRPGLGLAWVVAVAERTRGPG